jgi:hypothetical protein
MVKIRFDIPDETIRKIHEVLRERDKASKGNLLRDAIRDALFFRDAKKAGKHILIGLDTRLEMTLIVGLRGTGPLLDLHARREKGTVNLLRVRRRYGRCDDCQKTVDGFWASSANSRHATNRAASCLR